jgi:hypothetical protein
MERSDPQASLADRRAPGGAQPARAATRCERR